jgi:hypothetical protein
MKNVLRIKMMEEKMMQEHMWRIAKEYLYWRQYCINSPRTRRKYDVHKGVSQVRGESC